MNMTLLGQLGLARPLEPETYPGGDNYPPVITQIPTGGEPTPTGTTPTTTTGGTTQNTPSQPSLPPTWAVGTFYARRSDGQQMTLTISANGSGSLLVAGVTYPATVSGSVLLANGDRSNLVQAGDGFQTVRQDTGEVTIYSRTAATGYPGTSTGGTTLPYPATQTSAGTQTQPNAGGDSILTAEIDTSTALWIGGGAVAIFVLLTFFGGKDK